MARNRLSETSMNLPTLNGSKILASFIQAMRNNEINFQDDYIINVKDFLNSEYTYKEIRDTCSELIKSTLEFESFDKKGDFSFSILPIFSKITYCKDEITASFNNLIPDLLFELQDHFTHYSIIEYLTLSNNYTQRLFKTLQFYSSEDSIIIPLNELHKLLNTAKTFKESFAEFNRRILEPAHKEINKNTSLKFEWEAIKEEKQKIVALKFIFPKQELLDINDTSYQNRPIKEIKTCNTKEYKHKESYTKEELAEFNAECDRIIPLFEKTETKVLTMTSKMLFRNPFFTGKYTKLKGKQKGSFSDFVKSLT